MLTGDVAGRLSRVIHAAYSERSGGDHIDPSIMDEIVKSVLSMPEFSERISTQGNAFLTLVHGPEISADTTLLYRPLVPGQPVPSPGDVYCIGSEGLSSEVHRRWFDSSGIANVDLKRFIFNPPPAHMSNLGSNAIPIHEMGVNEMIQIAAMNGWVRWGL